jgi:hypothetical protein
VRQAFIVGQAQPGRHGHPPPSAYEQGRCSAGLRELGDEEAASTTRDAIDHRVSTTAWLIAGLLAPLLVATSLLAPLSPRSRTALDKVA